MSDKPRLWQHPIRSAGTLKPACRCVFAKSLNFSRKAKTSQAPSRQAEQPLPVPSTETKVMGMLGQLLDRFVPQEPHLTYETSQQAAMPTANWWTNWRSCQQPICQDQPLLPADPFQFPQDSGPTPDDAIPSHPLSPRSPMWLHRPKWSMLPPLRGPRISVLRWIQQSKPLKQPRAPLPCRKFMAPQSTQQSLFLEPKHEWRVMWNVRSKHGHLHLKNGHLFYPEFPYIYIYIGPCLVTLTVTTIQTRKKNEQNQVVAPNMIFISPY